MCSQILPCTYGCFILEIKLRIRGFDIKMITVKWLRFGLLVLCLRCLSSSYCYCKVKRTLIKSGISNKRQQRARGHNQWCIFRKIWLPSFTQKQVVLRKTCKNRHVFRLKSGQKPITEESKHKTEARYRLSMPKTPFVWPYWWTWIFLSLLGSNFELSSPTSRGFRHLAVVIIAPDTTSFGKDFW